MAFRKGNGIEDLNLNILNLKLPSPLETLSDQWLNKALSIKRDDLIHPIISGNKWRKIKGHLVHFKVNSYKELMSVGSAHSNHLHALAYICKELNIPFKALIYGIIPFGSKWLYGPSRWIQSGFV